MRIPPNGKWEDFGYKDERYILPSGRIAGRVSGGYRDYSAFTEAKNLGAYATVEQAKVAVEDALTLSVDIDK